jgi:hypothetical protein
MDIEASLFAHFVAAALERRAAARAGRGRAAAGRDGPAAGAGGGRVDRPAGGTAGAARCGSGR